MNLRTHGVAFAEELVLDGMGDWLLGVRRSHSPNYDDRPADCDIELLVVHSISLPPGEFGGPCIDALFHNTLAADQHPYFAEIASLRVSSHLLIRRDGEMIQYVPFTRRAWHAGLSRFGDRERCNDFSIGIELEGSDQIPYEAIQYIQLVRVTRCLAARWPRLADKRIVGHCDIAPGRKTDPGETFDWVHFRRLLA